MYTPVDKAQFHAYLIRQGWLTLPAEEQEIIDWISGQFSVVALNFFREVKETATGGQELVHVILDTPEDVKKLYPDRAANSAITERFLKYLELSELRVTFRPRKNITSETASQIRNEELRAVLKTFESAWTISQGVVFYYTDAQVKENLANGTSQKINEELAKTNERYGFDRGTPYTFDSKEAFDRDYESNWYYYWK